MRIPLNRDLVRSLIAFRFGSVPEFVDAWQERVDSGRQADGKAASLKTVYRWLSGGSMPSKSDALFGLAGTLDVDPVSVLDLQSDRFAELFAKERRLLQIEEAYHSPLSPLRALYFASPLWPHDEVATGYYGRPWLVKEFEHEAKEHLNVYAAVYLESLTADPPYPRTYHFAYRRAGDASRMWRPYGAVIGFKNEVLLFSESGDRQEVQTGGSPMTVTVETYFGEGPAEFRIASLHDFRLTLEVLSKGKSAVRFWA